MQNAQMKMTLLELDKHRGRVSKIGIATILFNFVLAHPSILKTKAFDIVVQETITELNNDPTIKACKRLQDAMNVVKNLSHP